MIHSKRTIIRIIDSGSRTRHPQAGFSLIELVVALALVAILLGLAAPSFQTYMANQRAQSISYRLMADLRDARSDAIAQNTNCSVKRVGSDWSSGWQIVDCGDDCSADGAGCPAASSLDGSRWNLTEANNLAQVTFKPSGRVDPSTTANFTLCPKTGPAIDERRLAVAGASIMLDRTSITCGN